MNKLPDILDGEDKSSPFKNCLRNNYRHIRKWAKRLDTNCFRIYDREVPGYPAAIDYYAGRFCIQYYAPSKDAQEPSEELQQKLNKAIEELFGSTEESLFWRTRLRSKETRQYEKLADRADYFTVLENGIKFYINLVDYLDTGLFLDHRQTRELVRKMAPGKRVLNLFAYTCSFSVYAAVGGASFTKSVDMSNTYTAWGKDNFILNGLSLKHNLIVREDCLKFLDYEREEYDIIVIDPPTISRSKKMERMFDVQEDYIELIAKSSKLLSDEGQIIFSTNSRRFKFDNTIFPASKEITSKTLPEDFKDQKIHRCWTIFKTQVAPLNHA